MNDAQDLINRAAQDLISRADAYALRTGLSPRTVSKRLFQDARRIDKLRENPNAIQYDTLNAARERMRRLEAEPRPAVRRRQARTP